MPLFQPWHSVSQRTATAIAAAGFALDSYDLFWANLSLAAISEHHPLSDLQQSLINCSTLLGAALGQFLFGKWLGTHKHAHGWPITVALFLTAASAAGCILFTLPFHEEQSTTAFCMVLISFRFLLGIGVGGEYPVSLLIAREHTPGGRQSELESTAIVFTMQGVGALLTPVVFLIVMRITTETEHLWRSTLAITIPWCLALVWPRLKLPEKYLDPNAESGDLNAKLLSETPPPDASRDLLNLVGASLAWFWFDVAFFANGLFNATIAGAFGLGNSIRDKAINVLILNIIGFPGYFIGAFAISRFDYKAIQLVGLALVSFLYAALAFGHRFGLDEMHPTAFIILYGCTFLVSNAGPDLTTFVIPGLVVSKVNRSSYEGYAGAAGKVGALLGALLLEPCLDRFGLFAVMLVCSACCFLAFSFTLALIDGGRVVVVANHSVQMNSSPLDAHVQQ